MHEEDHLVLTLPADLDPGPLATGYEVLGGAAPPTTCWRRTPGSAPA